MTLPVDIDWSMYSILSGKDTDRRPNETATDLTKNQWRGLIGDVSIWAPFGDMNFIVHQLRSM